MGNTQSAESHSQGWEDGKEPKTEDHNLYNKRELQHQHQHQQHQQATSASASSSTSSHHHPHPHHQRKPSSNRHVPPTTNLVSSASTAASTFTSTAQAHATTVSVSPKRAHTRARSSTTSAAIKKSSPPTRPITVATGTTSDPVVVMGNVESKARPPSRSNTLPTDRTRHEPAAAPLSEQPEFTPPPPPPSAPVTHPVDVPQPTFHEIAADRSSADAYINTPSYGLPPPIYSRPPRLPLPIEEEDHAPGSPILSPAEGADPVIVNDVDATLPRRTSVTSSAVDEDSSGDEMDDDDHGPRVPTKVEWNGRGEKIFVTGTFVNWERKLKLHRNKDGKPGYSAVLMLPPGTHHVKFLVDDDMTVSTDMPTTVDWTNILVNYIEVSAAPESVAVEPTPAPVQSTPLPIPGAGQSTTTTTSADPSAVSSQDARAQVDPASAGATPIDIGATPAKPHEPPAEVHPTAGANASAAAPPSSAPAPPAAAPTKAPEPRPRYTNEIPQFLLDFENLAKQDERHDRAARVIDHLPRPPTLPSTLSKSILNGTTPHKDDASVLLMPNHTVLNHLATSSIKHGVLATSGTTRYKRKFLTTIMYRPTTFDG